MFKKILSALIFSFFLSPLFAQDNPVMQHPLSDPARDTAYKKILLIPYNPMMHLSDADQDIAEYSGQNQQQIRAKLRYGLTKHVSAELMKVYQVQSMASNVLTDNEGELDMIYGSLNYKEDTIFPVAHPIKDTTQNKSFFAKKKSAKVAEIHDLKYMNIKLSHPELLQRLSEKYGTDLFLFLNQFDIVTNYSDCLDLANKIYKRQLKVHYSVFDVSGKLLYGDVAVVDFPSNSNDVDNIMEKNFPKLAEYIARTIPKK
jgi:hypothetical protein